MLTSQCLAVFQLALLAAPLWGAEQPYKWLNGGAFSSSPRPGSPFSPDPLFNYLWDKSVNQSQLQIYGLHPVQASTDQQGSFLQLETLVQQRGYPPNIIPTQPPTYSAAVQVLSPGAFRLDFGIESAGWLELLSDGVLH